MHCNMYLAEDMCCASSCGQQRSPRQLDNPADPPLSLKLPIGFLPIINVKLDVISAVAQTPVAMSLAAMHSAVFCTNCLQKATQVGYILLEPFHSIKTGEWVSKRTVGFIGFHLAYSYGKCNDMKHAT